MFVCSSKLKTFQRGFSFDKTKFSSKVGKRLFLLPWISLHKIGEQAYIKNNMLRYLGNDGTRS